MLLYKTTLFLCVPSGAAGNSLFLEREVTDTLPPAIKQWCQKDIAAD